MLKKLPVQPQLEMFKTVLPSFINPQHKLCLLAIKRLTEIIWKKSLFLCMEKVFKQIIDLFDKDFIRKEVKEVWVDTTVQEKNITFPTDRKLTEKAIKHFKPIAKKEDIKLK